MSAREDRVVRTTSIVEKGFVLKKRCGQFKPKEIYLRPEPIITLGQSPISISKFRESICTRGESKESDSRTKIYVPSEECLSYFSKVIIESSVYVDGDICFVIMQTVLRSTLADATYSTRKDLKELLLNSLTLKPVVFLNELYSLTCAPRRYAFGESSKVHNQRQFFVAVNNFFEKVIYRTETALKETKSEMPPSFAQSFDDIDVILLVADEEDSCFKYDWKGHYFPIKTQTMQKFVDAVCGIRNEGDVLSHPLLDILNSTLSVRKNYLFPVVDPTGLAPIAVVHDEYIPHLSRDEMHRGIQRGSLVSGELNVFPYSPEEAEVILDNALPLLSVNGSNVKFSSCLISGIHHRNRAVHGDIVVVQILPRDEWKMLESSFELQYDAENSDSGEVLDSVDDDIEEKISDVITSPKGSRTMSPTLSHLVSKPPTGKVVGILKRAPATHEIVASFPVITSASLSGSDDSNYVDKREKTVLLVPLDRRLPKISVRTRNSVSMGGKRVIAAMDSWSLRSRYPLGHIVRRLSAVHRSSDSAQEDLLADIEAMLLKNSVYPRPFSIRALSCLPDISHERIEKDDKFVTETLWKGSDWTITEDGMKFRKDLRNAYVKDLAPLCVSVQERSDHCELYDIISTSFGTDADTFPSRGSNEGDERIRIFSVDPEGCQDIDDAMSITPMPSSHDIIDSSYLLGIHIADVTAFVPEGCALDIEARSRGTTIYLPHQRLDMLPTLLASDIASLHGGRDRYAMTLFFSVRFSRRSTGDSISVPSGSGFGALLRDNLLQLDAANDLDVAISPFPCWAGRTALCSSAALTYDQAHRLMHNRPPNDDNSDKIMGGVAGGALPEDLWDPITGDLGLLTIIGRTLARQRSATGALDLEQSEGGQLKFGLDSKTGLPTAVTGSTPLEIHATIAELMVLANSTVARMIYHYMPSSTLLRSHGNASLAKLQEINEVGAAMGLNIFEGIESDHTAENNEDTDSSFSEDFLQNVPPTHVELYQEKAHRQLLQYKQQVSKFARQKKRVESSPAVDFFTSMVIRAMDEAKYVCSAANGKAFSNQQGCQSSSEAPGKQFEHFGLGLRFYTHYTSPIRRYADIIVHRQLVLVLQYMAKEKLNKLSRNMNGKVTVELDSGAVNDSCELNTSNIVPATLCNESMQMESNETLDFLDDVLGEVDDGLLSQQSKQLRDVSPSADENIDDFLDDILDGVNEDLIPDKEKADSPPNALPFSLSSQQDYPFQDEFREKLPFPTNRSPHKISSDAPVLYGPGKLERIASHLNDMNRRGKRVQTEAQELFLTHYFAHTCEVHSALVYSLRANGFLAYLPAFQFKGPVFMTNKDGIVCGHPHLFSSSSNSRWKVGSVLKEKDREQVEFPEYECKLHKVSADEVQEGKFDELLVQLQSESSSVLKLHHMQRVLVSVTAATSKREGTQQQGSRMCSVPEIRLTLLSISEAVDNKNLKSTIIRDRKVPTFSGDFSGGNNISVCDSPCKTSLYVANESPEKTLYELLRPFKKLALIDTKSSIEESKSKSVGNSSNVHTNQVAGRRWNIPNTGRLCFFDETKEDCIEGKGGTFFPSSVFLSKGRTFGDEETNNEHRKLSRIGIKAIAKHTTSLGERTGKKELAATGKELAMHRMKQWGEEWAEEEELPSTFVEHSDDVVNESMPSSLKKEVAKANARQQKLKIAKKNSKY